ncbi:MAG: protein-(glutamine-N5) methyltransferase, release factor-specific [Epulopiscium sp. Nele67-Bin004]|nr:MAG: protein-(glutamine-N5) methyltransferase, release factor-specific [Epulopiscium sp. Nele67-Bin004]
MDKLLQIGQNTLEESGVIDAKIDARLLLMHVLNCDRTHLILNSQAGIEEKDVEKYIDFIQRRAKRQPLQHITNEQQFMGLSFYVDSRVLIPRQDTELLVETVLEYKPKNVLEIGVGSGCIAISIAHFLQDTKVTAVDISGDAIEVAMQNAKANNVDIIFVQGDVFENVSGTFDLIVSNPPYIPHKETFDLMDEVINHEPHIALTDGGDGLEFYRRIAKDAKLHLNGILALEIGHNQGNDVIQILENELYTNIRLLKDYNDKDRVVVAEKNLR